MKKIQNKYQAVFRIPNSSGTCSFIHSRHSNLMDDGEVKMKLKDHPATNTGQAFIRMKKCLALRFGYVAFFSIFFCLAASARFTAGVEPSRPTCAVPADTRSVVHRQANRMASGNPLLIRSIHDCALYLDSCYQMWVMPEAADNFVELMRLNLNKADSLVVCWPGDVLYFKETLGMLFMTVADSYSSNKIEALVVHADSLFPKLRDTHTPSTIFDVCWYFLYNSSYYKKCNLRVTVLFALNSKDNTSTPWLLSNVADTLKDDYDIIFFAVNKDGLSLKSASLRLQQDTVIVRAAIRQNAAAFQYTTISMRDNEGLCLLAISGDWTMAQYFSLRLKGDTAFARLVFKVRPRCFQYFSSNVQDIKEFALLALADSVNIAYVSQKLRKDRDVVLLAFTIRCDAIDNIDAALLNDSSFARAALKICPGYYSYYSSAIRDIKDIALGVVGYSSAAYYFVSSRLAADRDVALLAVKQDCDMINHVASKLLNDTLFARSVLPVCPQVFHYFSLTIRGIYDLALQAAMNDSGAVKYISDGLKDDSTFARTVIFKYPQSFIYFSERIRSMRDLALIAVLVDGTMIRNVPETLRNDTAFARRVLEIHPDDFPYFSPAIQAMRDLALLAVSKQGKMLQYVSDELKDDSAFVLAAVSNFGTALQFASTRLRGNRTIVEAAVLQDGLALQYALGFSDDTDICLEAVGRNAQAISYVSQRLLHDTAFARIVIGKQASTLLAFPDSIKNMREFVILAAANDGGILQHLSLAVRDDKEIALAAVRSNSLSIMFLSDRLKEDREVLLAALEFASPIAMTQDYHGVYSRVTKPSKDLIDATTSLLGLSSYFSRAVLMNRYELCSTTVRSKLRNLWDTLLVLPDTAAGRPVCVALYAGDPTFPYYDYYLHQISKSYRLYFYNAWTDGDIVSNLLEATKNRGKQADVLMIAGHGTSDVIRLGLDGSSVILDEKRYFDISDSDLSAALRGCIKRGGMVIHHACANAEHPHGNTGSPGNLEEFAHAAFWPDAYSYAADFSFSQMAVQFQNGTIGGVTFDDKPPVIIPPDYLSSIAGAGAAMPHTMIVHTNFPNPFSRSTTFSFEVNRETRVTVTISDVLGRRVRTLIRDEVKSQGNYFLQWDGNNDAGKSLPEGAYFLEATGGFKTQVIIVVKKY